MPEARKHTGGCHCGKVRYEVTADIGQVVSCNCSICQKRGFLWAFTDPQQFKLLSGEDELAEYQFYRKVLHHRFCKTCGVQAFARGKAPSGKEMVAINVRCLDDVDVGALTLAPFDGKSL